MSLEKFPKFKNYLLSASFTIINFELLSSIWVGVLILKGILRAWTSTKMAFKKLLPFKQVIKQSDEISIGTRLKYKVKVFFGYSQLFSEMTSEI